MKIPGVSFSLKRALGITQLKRRFTKATGIPTTKTGVEAYKKNMFALLNKPGYEEESKAIQARL